MNIEAYDAELLRNLVRTLQQENTTLKEKLKSLNIPFEETPLFEEQIENSEEYDPDQGGRIIFPKCITDDMAKGFFRMFWGRHDVFCQERKERRIFSSM